MAEEKEEESLELVEDTPDQQEENASSENTENEAVETPAIEENQDFAKKKKPNIVKLALFGVIGLLSTILIIGIILYFIGFFDNEEEMKMETSNKKTKTQMVVEKEEPKFSLKDINTKVLNKQLAELTNKSIKEEQEAQRIKELEDEKERLESEKQKHKEKLKQEEEKLVNLKNELEKKKKKLEEERVRLNQLKEEALKARERLLKEKEEVDETELLNSMNQANMMNSVQDKKEESMQKDSNMTMSKNNESNNDFLLLINVAKIKGELYKDYFDKVLEISTDVKLCRDDNNNIEIYFGPFKNNSDRTMIFEKLQEADFENSYELEMMKEEFDKRCNY